MSLLVGGTFCALAVAFAMLRGIAEQLAHDGLVMRALGVTLAMAAIMLGRVALAASAGLRRAAALAVAAPSLALALMLLAWPSGAALLYDRGLGWVAPGEGDALPVDGEWVPLGPWCDRADVVDGAPL